MAYKTSSIFIQDGSQSWPKRMTTTLSSSPMMAWSTCQPFLRCWSMYDILEAVLEWKRLRIDWSKVFGVFWVLNCCLNFTNSSLLQDCPLSRCSFDVAKQNGGHKGNPIMHLFAKVVPFFFGRPVPEHPGPRRNFDRARNIFLLLFPSY